MTNGKKMNPMGLLATKNRKAYEYRHGIRSTFLSWMTAELSKAINLYEHLAPYIDLFPLLQMNDTPSTVQVYLIEVNKKLRRIHDCNTTPRYWQCDCPAFCEYCLSAFRYKLLRKLEDIRPLHYKMYFRRHVISIPRGVLFDGNNATYLLHNHLGPRPIDYMYSRASFQEFIQSPPELFNPIHNNDMYSLYSAIFEGTSMYNPRVDQTLTVTEMLRRRDAINKLILKGGGRTGQRYVLWNGDYFVHSIINTLEMERRAITLSNSAGTASRIVYYPDMTTNLMCLELQSVFLSHDEPEKVLPDGLLYFGSTQAPRRIKLNEVSDMYATSSVSLETKTTRTKRTGIHKQLEYLFNYNKTLDNLTPLELAIYTLGMAGLRTTSTSGILR